MNMKKTIKRIKFIHTGANLNNITERYRSQEITKAILNDEI